MVPRRSPRSITTVLLALILALAAMAGPAITIAATPNWNQSSSIVGLPPTISVDAAAGYRAKIVNSGPSSIPSLYVSAAFSQPFVATSAAGSGDPPIYVKLTKNGIPLVDACGPEPPVGAVSCTVGELTAGSTAVLVVAYDTDADIGTSAGVTVRWTTVGLGSGGKDKSRGDALTQTFQTTFGDADFDGEFTTEATTELETNQALNSTNLFGTKFTASGESIPVAIEDDASASFAACPAGKECYGKAGQDAILFSINEGAEFAALTPLTITVYKSAVPKNANVSRVTVVHYFTIPPPAPALPYESISNDCPKSGTPTGTCRTVSWNGSLGIWTIVVYLEENGVVKFH